MEEIQDNNLNEDRGVGDSPEQVPIIRVAA
jgi:hypothetical protein